MDPSHIDVLHLSSRGGINRLHAQLHSDKDVDLFASDRSQGFMWNDDVMELAGAGLDVTGSDRFTARESSTVNLGPAYQGRPPVHDALHHLYSYIFKTFSSPLKKRMRAQTLHTMPWTVSQLSGRILMPL